MPNLILSRYQGERVLISAGPHRIWVEVNELRGDKVRLAFLAESDVVIHREEIAERIAAGEPSRQSGGKEAPPAVNAL